MTTSPSFSEPIRFFSGYCQNSVLFQKLGEVRNLAGGLGLKQTEFRVPN
jgi:hypothetical protein